jgi:hypothetical protein
VTGMLRWLLNLPFLLLWNTAYGAVRMLMLMRRWASPAALLLILLVVPLLGFSVPRLDRAASWLMVGAALLIAFVAGQMSRRK